LGTARSDGMWVHRRTNEISDSLGTTMSGPTKLLALILQQRIFIPLPSISPENIGTDSFRDCSFSVVFVHLTQYLALKPFDLDAVTPPKHQIRGAPDAGRANKLRKPWTWSPTPCSIRLRLCSMHLVSSLPGSGNGGEQRCHLSVVFPPSIMHGATGTRQTPQSLPRVHGSHRWAVNLF
jgi:hypothetical protein